VSVVSVALKYLNDFVVARVPLKRSGPVVKRPEHLAALRRNIQLKYNVAVPGDDPEPLTDYEDVSYKRYSCIVVLVAID